MAPEIKYTKLFINNEWVDSVSRKTFATINPQDGSIITHVAEGDKADIDLAVAAAKKAFKRGSEWRRMDASDRGRLLNKFADLIEKNAEYLAQLETLDNGMLIALTTNYLIKGLIQILRYQASMSDKVEGSTIPADGEILSYTRKQPIGVCGLILPWNSPAGMLISKASTALAAGCTVVVKPAEQTPLSALYLASLAQEAGFPPGVINVVNGYGPTAGAALTHHPDVAKISFTGSCEVGKIIQAAAGAVNLKRVSLELGGKSPLVIFNDANLDMAVPLAARVVFMNQGQVCIAASRLYVQSGIYDKFVERAAEFAKNIKIGSSFDLTTQHGPQVDEEMFNKVLGYIESGKKSGARLVAGGGRHGTSGYFIKPTVFADVTDDMKIAKEEIFGPVQSILKFETFEEVVERANDTNFGLAAGVITNDLTTALAFTEAVEAGNVWVNTYAVSPPQVPFGGFKDSGVGREKGQCGIEEYLETKTVVISIPKSPKK